MMMNVIIYHNNESDFFTPYADGQPLAPVFVYPAEVPGSMAQPDYEAACAEAERAFLIGQNGVPQIGDENPALNARYSANRLRSVSVGDVIQVGVYALAVGRVAGMVRVDGALNIQRDKYDNFR